MNIDNNIKKGSNRGVIFDIECLGEIEAPKLVQPNKENIKMRIKDIVMHVLFVRNDRNLLIG